MDAQDVEVGILAGVCEREKLGTMLQYWERAFSKTAKPASKPPPTFLDSMVLASSQSRYRPQGILPWVDISDEQLFRLWIMKHGGYIHPSLRLLDSPTCEGRGWMAIEDIDMHTVSCEPLIVIPNGLCLNSKDAYAAVLEAVRSMNLPVDKKRAVKKAAEVYLGSDKNERTALAACLAYERSRGAKSPFYPYLRLLPKKPPSLWLKTPADVKSILSSAGTSRERKEIFMQIADAYRREEETITKGVQRFLDVTQLGIRLGISAEDFQCAYNLVNSRAYEHTSGQSSTTYIPVGIDFLNHGQTACSMLMLDSHTHSSFEHATAIQMLISVMDGVPCRLSKGSELFVLYPPGRSGQLPLKCPKDDAEMHALLFHGQALKWPTAYDDGNAIIADGRPSCKMTSGEYKELFSCLDDILQQTEHPLVLNLLGPVLQREKERQMGWQSTSSLDWRNKGQVCCANPKCSGNLSSEWQLCCSKCREPYCSYICQMGDWPRHVENCSPVSQRSLDDF